MAMPRFCLSFNVFPHSLLINSSYLFLGLFIKRSIVPATAQLPNKLLKAPKYVERSNTLILGSRMKRAKYGVLVRIEEIGCAKCRWGDRACLARGVRGHVSPENFENKGVKWCTLGGFWGHLNRKTVTQIPEFSGLYLYFIIQL